MNTSMKKSGGMDMTQGSIALLLLKFSVPLLLGNLFQQLYNTVDTLVVGNYVGKEALAAVGSCGPITNTMVSFFNGISIGAGVVISQSYGAKNEKKLHLAIETTMTLTFLCSVLMTLLGVFTVRYMLVFMATPEDVLEPAGTYLKIYFAGIMGLMFYNMGSGILRAVGDTIRPLLFLILSSLMNIVLDLFFVVNLQMGIAGVAYATIISQFASAILITYLLCKSKEVYRFSFRDVSLDMGIFHQILTIGLPTGFQQALTSFSNVFVQAYINSFGSSCMAGWSCYSKIDQFVMLPLQSIGQAATTFVGQNIGAGNIKRAKKGTWTAISIGVVIAILTGLTLVITAPQMVYLFNQDPSVVYYGSMFIRLCVMFMVFCCFNMTMAGSLRGIGEARMPMIIMLGSFVFFRQLYLFVATRISNTPAVVAFGYPAGWILAGMGETLYYKFSNWEKRFEKQEEKTPVETA